ncbi:hypothetical protein BKG89_10135 [Rodentibacter caecimuris]|uniref:Uncharacterized protein n=1 Tax=Rodentibacter caecimuris TaxID=1796644 RepID=A0ABX3KYH8_9PAST|nr:hypothetical protein BKG89_10135 [Rodentibacter heylii]
MKDDLILTKNAMFYKNTQGVTVENIIEEIMDIASSNKNEKEFILNDVNSYSDIDELNYIYSVKVFQINRPVYFSKDKELFDLVHAYILILEIDDYIIVFSKNTSNVSKELKEKFQLIKSIDFANTLANDSEYQKLTLRNMTISDKDIRARSYEAQNLNGLLSLHSAGRSIPANMKIKEKNRTISLSNTGRIVENSGSINIDSLALWAKSQIELLNNTNKPKDSFIHNFARSVELSEILEGNIPTAVLLEYHSIYDYIESINTPIFRKLKNGKYCKICDKRIELIFNEIAKVYEVNKSGICYSGINKLRVSKSGLSIQSPDLRRFYLKEDSKFISLQSAINKKKLFSVTFTDPSYMYFMGNCFQDNSNTSEVRNILDCIEIFLEMSSINSEKGNITNSSKRFESCSLFDLIERIHTKKKDKYIFCDDLGDEWADHITINDKENCISFIHSKHKDTSSSASNLHDVVGQAIKNIGNMRFSKEKFLKKKQTLDKFYNKSKIHRVRRGNLDTLGDDLDKVLKQHSLHRKCIIACSFLSKQNLEDEFNKLVSKQEVKGHIVQLVWILSSFIHAAKESGVIPIIYCKP